MLCLMLGSNGVMLTSFAKAMQRCNSTAEAVSVNSAANFILTVSAYHRTTWNLKLCMHNACENMELYPTCYIWCVKLSGCMHAW